MKLLTEKERERERKREKEKERERERESERDDVLGGDFISFQLTLTLSPIGKNISS